MTRSHWLVLTAALVALAPAAIPAPAAAQEATALETPEPGFVAAGPRTMVSFVRQSLGDAAAAPLPDAPRWSTILHVSNAGSGPLAFTAVFVSEDGLLVRGRRFAGVAPGQTLTFGAAALLGDDVADLPPLVRGVIRLRFFVPGDLLTTRLFADTVAAEAILDRGPDSPAQVIPLQVSTPQILHPLSARPDRTGTTLR